MKSHGYALTQNGAKRHGAAAGKRAARAIHKAENLKSGDALATHLQIAVDSYNIEVLFEEAGLLREFSKAFSEAQHKWLMENNWRYMIRHKRSNKK